MSEKSKIHTLPVKYCDDTDDMYLELPPDILESMQWDIGDTLKWVIDDDGNILLKKPKYENVELDFDEDELLKYLLMAHEMNITFNEFVEKALQHVIERQTGDE